MIAHSKVCSTDPGAEGFYDLTDEVHAAIADSGIEHGRVSVVVSEPRCAVFLNENESGLRRDLGGAIERHGAEALAGATSVVVPVVEGRPYLGGWQRVLTFSLERGQTELVIQIIGT